MATAGRVPDLSAYAALVRVPNLFTAPPDVLLGAALALAAGQAVSPVDVSVLALSSAVLYAGGTTLNDAVDAPVDAVQRPERPIPRGRVSRRTAFGLASVLFLVGILAAALVSDVAAGYAGLLVAAIVSYDVVLGETAFGPLAMGTTRGLNVVLGTAAGGTFALEGSLVLVPIVIGGYVAAVTAMAAHEASGGTRRTIVAAGLGVVLATVGVVGTLVTGRPPRSRTVLALVLLTGFTLWTGRALAAAYERPDPSTVGGAVGQCVLALVVLDSAFAAVTGVGWALVVLAFLVPAVGLSLVFDVT